jgi:hypothetical protein
MKPTLLNICGVLQCPVEDQRRQKVSLIRKRIMVEAPGGFAQTYGVQLLYETPPKISRTEIARYVAKRCPSAELADGEENDKSLHFLHRDHLVKLVDGYFPASTVIVQTEEPFKLTEAMTASLQQSWSFPGAAELVGRCRNTIFVTGLMSSGLEYKERLELFQDALAGILEVLPALAIHWQPTGQFVNPRRFLDAYQEGGSSRFFAGSLNVRFYRISNSPGDMLMDTLGLGALGLPDLQCHYRSLVPGEVAALLANTGYYIFENGDVIENGHTVEGIAAGSKWRCQHEEAMRKPSRVVLDLDPGSPHAAGDRKSHS